MKRHHEGTMNKVAIIIVSLVIVVGLGLGGCARPAPAPAPAPPPQAQGSRPTPTPVPTNSESDSRVAELEAQIRQLESENQRLLMENQELSNELAEVSSMLKSFQSEIPNLLIMVTQIQDDASQLAAFLQGLPALPTPPPGLDNISKVNDVVTKAVLLRTILEKLPPPPPLIAPAEWYELDEMKNEFIKMTEWMEGLEELPEFLNTAGDLDNLRYQEISHLENISAIMSNIKSILERIQE